MTPIGTLLFTLREYDNILFCDGRELLINEYKEFADFCIKQYGKANYFGGDGIKSIGLPDIQGWSIVVRNIEDRTAKIDDTQDNAISRKMAIESAECIINSPSEMKALCIVKMLTELPPLEPKTGHWIDNMNGTYTCDKCGCKHSRSNYCPNCGSKNVEVSE